MKLGIDIGGTKVAMGVVHNGKIIKYNSYLLSGKEKLDKNEFINSLISNIQEIVKGYDIRGIGVASPGPLDSSKGTVLNTPNIKSIRNMNIVRILEKKFNTNVTLEHDSSAAAIAEASYFNKKNLFYLSLGTGVGNGIVIDGRIYKGIGQAAEGGHITIKFDGVKANCNNEGCLEEYISARGISMIAKKHGLGNLNSLQVSELADKGDKRAKDVFKEMGLYLGIGLVNFINVMQPEIVVIGGGISKSAKHFLPEAIKTVKERALIYNSKIKIVASELRDKAGILGAVMILEPTA